MLQQPVTLTIQPPFHHLAQMLTPLFFHLQSRHHHHPQDPPHIEYLIPRISYDSEIQLEKANAEYKAKGTHLNPSPKLKSHILEALADKIIKFKAYPTDLDLNAVAEALIQKHPCLRELGSFNGCYGWKISLKYKMANFRTKLRSVGCPEVSVNSLKNKPQDQCHAALKVKKPRRAEVNYCPEYPRGETSDSLERERVELLSEIKKRNNEKVVKEKIQKTFSYRRQEVVQENPMVAEFKTRWPALFSVSEINAEFMRITTYPLQHRFFAMLDQYSDRLMRLFLSKGGVTGRKIRNIMVVISQDSEPSTTKRDMEQTVMAVYVIRSEGAEATDDPADVGVLIEGVEVLQDLGNIALACAMLFGVIYTLNLSYPQYLKCTFEVLQKVLMNLDGQRLSPKAQALKNKLFE